MITKPTRVTATTATLIDNIYTRFKHHDTMVSGVINADISDHFPVFILAGKATPKKKQKDKITYMPMTENSIANIKTSLTNHDWELLHNMDLDTANNYFSAFLTQSLDRFAPERTV